MRIYICIIHSITAAFTTYRYLHSMPTATSKSTMSNYWYVCANKRNDIIKACCIDAYFTKLTETTDINYCLINCLNKTKHWQKNYKLEIRGRAQREAAWCPMPDYGNDLGFKILLLATRHGEWNRTSLRCMRSVDFGWVKMSLNNFFVSRPPFTKSILSEIIVDNAVFRLSISSAIPKIFAIEI